MYGFYEALDFTPSRLPEDTRVAVVRAYMAHHQGMTLVSLGNVVHRGRTRDRFHDHPLIQAAELLLQERTPRAVSVTRPRGEEVREAALVRDATQPILRMFESPHDITPRTHFLSNGRYTVMITASGSGFSRMGNMAITRWREDATRDCWGTYIYLRDAESGEVWSAGFQPSGTEMDSYEVLYSEDRAKIQQVDRSLSISLEIVVSPEDDAELRKVTVTNLESKEREIDLTSYAEGGAGAPASGTRRIRPSRIFLCNRVRAGNGGTAGHPPTAFRGRTQPSGSPTSPRWAGKRWGRWSSRVIGQGS